VVKTQIEAITNFLFHMKQNINFKSKKLTCSQHWQNSKAVITDRNISELRKIY